MAKNTFHGVPAEWKRPQRRASCPYCGSKQWTMDGRMPADHDRPDGRHCRKFPIFMSISIHELAETSFPWGTNRSPLGPKD